MVSNTTHGSMMSDTLPLMLSRYCPANTSLPSFLQGELSLCLIDTATNPLILVVAILAGLHQLRLYRRFSTEYDGNDLPFSLLYLLQMALQLLLPCIATATLLLHTLGLHQEVCGVHILSLTTSILSWTVATLLTRVERTHQLPISARHGHGPVLLIFWTLAFMQVNFRLVVVTTEPWWHEGLASVQDKAALGLYCARYLITCGVFVLGLRAPGLSPIRQPYSHFPQEETSNTSASEGSTWRGFWGKVGKLLPYMWPKKAPMLQFQVVLCVLLLVGLRVTNVFVPIYYKNVVDSLGSSQSVWPWREVTVWVVLKLLQGGGMGQGLLNNARSLLWIKVQQFTTREIQVGLFKHLHGLSLRWHLGRKTGEVLRVMDRGTNSINSLMQYLVFSILPTIIDIIVAIVYFAVVFNIWFGLVILATMAAYLISTIAITEWRTKYRRKMNTADNEQRTRSVDSLLNAETVKYFSAEEWEAERYREAIVDYQTEEWKSSASLLLLNMFQGFTMNGGFLGLGLYCSWLVSAGTLTVGDFVLLGAYFSQLMGPLNWLGTLYRVIQESFVNMENMFDLMAEPVEVQDPIIPKAFPTQDQSVGNGKDVVNGPELIFDGVSFAYEEEKPVLQDVSFVVPAGTSTGIVGSSGSGKTTLAKLILRMYDVKEGAVKVAGVDIREVAQSFLRKAVAMVPQDIVLFNNTILFNIRYGKVDSSQEEVEEASKAAGIHDAILNFPNGYDTVVGERGLKLSGGEKQRVGLARALLMKPSMMVLDEATSALDSSTEREIQRALEAASVGRTMVVVAHRLSTVVGCQQILVVEAGQVIERGSHHELVELGGKYAEMWKIQNREEEEDKDGGEDEKG